MRLNEYDLSVISEVSSQLRSFALSTSWDFWNFINLLQSDPSRGSLLAHKILTFQASVLQNVFGVRWMNESEMQRVDVQELSVVGAIFQNVKRHVIESVARFDQLQTPRVLFSLDQPFSFMEMNQEGDRATNLMFEEFQNALNPYLIQLTDRMVVFWGEYLELIRVRAQKCLKKSNGIDFETAALVPFDFLTRKPTSTDNKDLLDHMHNIHYVADPKWRDFLGR